MSKLVALREALDAVDPGGSGRCDGWTGPRRRTFLESLAEGRTVEAACEEVRLSVTSAYALRRRAGGEAFAIAWRAAALLARERLADVLVSRAIDGQTDTYTRADGQEVTRHRYDNRLAMSVLTRLDRLAERPDPFAGLMAAGAADGLVPAIEDAREVARIAADAFPAFLDLVEQEADVAAVRAFVTAEISRRNPQLPQLRSGEDGEQDEEDEDIWWNGRAWVTSRPPPRGFTGHEHLQPGHPRYWRHLSLSERLEREG